MKVNEIKEHLGKEVFYKSKYNNKPNKYILNAYIFRVDPRDSTKRLKQAELQDTSSPYCVIITALDDVKLKS